MLFKNVIKTNDSVVLSEILNLSNYNASDFKDLDIVKQIFFTGLSIGENKIFTGDILKVSYVDATSKIFEQMKENGDKEIYLIIDDTLEYLATKCKTNNEFKYFTGNSESLLFLRYLIQKEVVEIVGNVNTHEKFLKEITITKEQYCKEIEKNTQLSFDANKVEIIEEIKLFLNNQTAKIFNVFIDEIKTLSYGDKEIKVYFDVEYKDVINDFSKDISFSKIFDTKYKLTNDRWYIGKNNQNYIVFHYCDEKK